MVMYGSSHSPITPRRLNCPRWMSSHFSAYFRQRRRNSTADISFFFEPRSLSTFSSMGRPWQSQPGTYGASYPNMVRLRTTMSFRTLLRTVPRWMSPLA